MPRPDRRNALEQQLLQLLAAHPEGLSSPRLRARLRPPISQPTLSRLLLRLRAGGRVQRTGSARATRYHLVGGRIQAAELRSLLLHRQVAERLVRHPELKARVLERLEKIRTSNPAGRPYHDAWARLLDAPMPDLLRTMTEDSERAATLRRESPFTTLFDPVLRDKLFSGSPRRPRRPAAR